ncbi:MAG: rod shape-determining protein RodA [Candidatus Obscuribacterales bacterium]|nr:rod shape-determining protein RodA [Candidatus Obscuribacterales bacterium]
MNSSTSSNSYDEIVKFFSRLTAGIDIWLLAATGFLIYTGLTVLRYSELTYGYYEKQLDFFWAGLALMVIFSRIPYRFWVKKWVIPIIYLGNLGLLLAVMLKGHAAQGAQRWLSLGPITLQPSELSKIVVIFTLAAWLKYFPIRSFWDIFKLAAITLPPAFLVFKQPDLGTSLTFAAVFMGMSFWMGATIADIVVLTSPGLALVLSAANTQWWLYFIGGLGVFLLIFWRVKDWNIFVRIILIAGVLAVNYAAGDARPHLWGHLKEYQQKRLTSFVNPYADPRGSGYHILQSLIAIGSGGPVGKGLGQGEQSQGAFIPERHTDFIFAVVGEELGFKISALVVLAYATICIRALIIAFACRGDPSGSAMAIGLMCMFVFHSFVNMGMTMGIMPVTGVPLPFLSYGGTALLVDLVAVGILQSIYLHIPKPKKDAWSSKSITVRANP